MSSVAYSPRILVGMLLSAAALAVGSVEAPQVILGAIAIAAMAWATKRSAEIPLVLFAGLLHLEAIAVTNLAGKALMLVVVVLLVVRRWQLGPSQRRQSPAFAVSVASVGVLSAWVIASMSWAVDVERSSAALTIWLPSVLLFLAVANLVPEISWLRNVLAALVAGAVVSIGVGLLGFSEPEQGRLVGGAGDPNFLAYSLPAALVLAALWTLKRTPDDASAAKRTAIRIGAGGAVIFLTVGLGLTGSRGGLVALAMAMLGGLLVAGSRSRSSQSFLGLCAIGATVLAAVLFSPIGRRFFVSDGGTGRDELWRVAIAITNDHPISGVGLDNYPVVAPEYTRSVGVLEQVDLISLRPHQSHSIYLQVLAELGAVGFIALLGFLGSCLFCYRLAAARFWRNDEPENSLLAATAGVATLSVLVGALFLPLLFEKRLWLLLALGPAFERCSRRRMTKRIVVEPLDEQRSSRQEQLL